MFRKLKVKKLSLKKLFVIGFFAGALLVVFSSKVISYTSTDEFCMSCHVHPHAGCAQLQEDIHIPKNGFAPIRNNPEVCGGILISKELDSELFVSRIAICFRLILRVSVTIHPHDD